MKRIFAAGFILCLSCQSFATYSRLPSNTSRFYIGAGGGELFYNINRNNSLGTGAGWPNDYYGSNNIANQPSGFIAVGYAWQRENNWFPNYSLELRCLYAPPTNISGYIDQYSLPGFKNYHYSYDVAVLSLLAVVKANLYRWYDWMPYVLLGAGNVNYSTSDYSEQALSNVTPRVSPQFTNSSDNNFAYQLGAGLDFALQKNVLLNIEYDYMNYGTVYTGAGVNYTTLTGANYNNSFLKNNLSASSFFLGMTYYIE